MSEALARLPELAAAHLRLVLLALFVSTLVAVPLGIAAQRRPRLARLILGAASVVQTIPALALLAAMVPLLAALGLPGIGPLPALIALVVYAILPIARNTVTGLAGVDEALREAARGVGMTDAETLRRVELPLALPVVVAGLRTASVWTVGMATLSTPVGAAGLGDLIFAGLQTRQPALLLVGCGAASALALVLDLAIALAMRGAETRKRGPALAGAAIVAACAVLAMLPRGPSGSGGAPLRIGAKTFTEQLVLAEILADAARDAGADVEVRGSLGSTVAFDALAAGEIDVYVDYSGTLWANVLHHDTLPPRAELSRRIAEELRDAYGVEVLAALGFENAYALAVREDEGARRSWSSLADLARDASTLRLGVDYELLHRGEWSELVGRYGLRFAETRTMDPALLYEALAAGEVDVASVYTTDGRVAALGLRTLADPRGALPPYDALVLARVGLAVERPEVVRALRALEGRIDASAMREMNAAVDREGRSPREAAALFLRAAE